MGWIESSANLNHIDKMKLLWNAVDFTLTFELVQYSEVVYTDPAMNMSSLNMSIMKEVQWE